MTQLDAAPAQAKEQGRHAELEPAAPFVGVEAAGAPGGRAKWPFRAVWSLPLAWLVGGGQEAGSADDSGNGDRLAASLRCESFCRTAEEAARIWDAVRVVLLGERGAANFPASSYSPADLRDAAELLDGMLGLAWPDAAGKRRAPELLLPLFELRRGSLTASVDGEE